MRYDVTIGIPVYMSEAYLHKTLESALSQTYSSIEFLIIDDGSSDASVKILMEMKDTHPRGSDIRVITHSENMGVSATRNQIIDEAQGEFLYFMDSDDLISENTIALLMQKICEYDAEIAFGSYERIGLDGQRTIFQYPSLPLLGEDMLASYAYHKYSGIQASACNYLLKTSLLRDNSLRFIDSNYWEDLVFTFDLVTYVSRAVLLSDVTYSYLCHDGSLSNYQERSMIQKSEILKNIETINHLKVTSSLLYNKVYYPNRCKNIVMTDFYIACNILKRGNNIVPPFSHQDIKLLMSHPATFRQICSFRQSRMSNMLLFFLGKMPSIACVMAIWCLGKLKKLV